MPPRSRRLALVLSLLYAFMALQTLGGLRWDSDEGINWAKGRLVADAWAGVGAARLYREIWSDQPPLYTLVTARPIAVAGLRGARATTVFFAMVGLLGTALAAASLARAAGLGPRVIAAAGPAAVLLLAVAPNFWWASRAAMIGLPAFALGAAAMGCLVGYLIDGRASQLILAGGLLGLSLVTKLQLAYLGPIAVLAILADPAHRVRRRVRHAALFTGLTLGPLALAALAFGPTSFWQQVFGSYLSTRSHYSADLSANVATLRTWVSRDHRELAGLCAAGLLALLATPLLGGADPAEPRRPRKGILAILVYTAWLLLTVLTPLQHAPLWIKDHFLPLLLALVPAGGVAVGIALDLILGVLRGRAADGRRWLYLPAAFAALFYLVGLPRLLRLDLDLLHARSYDNDGQVAEADEDQALSQQRKDDAVRAAALWLRATTDPGAAIVTDHQLVAAWAERRVLPAFAAYSSRAVGIGAFDDLVVRQALEDRPPAAVLLWDADIAASAGLAGWLKAHCGTRDADFGMERSGYLCAAAPTGGPIQPVSRAVLGTFPSALLLGWALDPGPADSSAEGYVAQTVDLRLFWQARRASELPLSVSVHVLDALGAKVAQHDGTPSEGGRPTDEWQPGEVIVDRHRLTIPIGTQGPLRARIGLYEPLGGQREGLLDAPASADGPTDAVDLALPDASTSYRFDPLETAP